MRNIALIIEYEGTAYSGWQRQDNATTLQQILEEKISEITGESLQLVASGRTDAGVHALGQVASFVTGSNIPQDRFAAAINTKLPLDIGIKHSYEVPLDFHPRYDAHEKTYRFRIYNAPMRSPLERNFSHYEKEYLQIEKMEQEAQKLLGEHDFTSFCSAGSQVKTMIRTIYQVRVQQQVMGYEKDGFPASIITFEITGNGFLYNMVRIIAGTLIEMGKGNPRFTDMKEIIQSKDRTKAGPTAKAQGLYLLRVTY